MLRQSKTLRLPGNVSLELETVRPWRIANISRRSDDKKWVESASHLLSAEDGAIGSEYVDNASQKPCSRASNSSSYSALPFRRKPAKCWIS